jgi:hypothetical protein
MKLDEWKCRCPYGKWNCADGREVLFNRNYWPIVERRPGEPAKPAGSCERVPWVDQSHYFHDCNSPWRGGTGRFHQDAMQTLARCNEVLAAWGLPPLAEPPKGAPWQAPRWSDPAAWDGKRILPPRRSPYQLEGQNNRARNKIAQRDRA